MVTLTSQQQGARAKLFIIRYCGEY